MNKAILLLGIILIQLGCVTEKKARLRAIEFYREHPAELAQTCADKFPINAQYIPGITITRKDSIIQRGIVLNCPETIHPDTKQSYIPKVNCPDQKIIYINQVRVDTLKVENKARVEQYQLEKREITNRLVVANSAYQTAKVTSQQRLYLIIILTVLLAVALFLRIKNIL